MINIIDFNPKNIKTDKKSYTDVLIYHNGYETSDDVKLLYVDFKKLNGYTEDNNGSKQQRNRE